VSWVLVPEANHPGALLAGDPGGRFRCAGQPPSLIEEASGTQRRLSWGFAVAASFSGDGRRLALATYTDLAVIDTETMALVAEFGHHNDPEGDTYTSVALNQDGTVLASGSLGGGRSCLWTVATGQPGMRIGGRWVAFSPDGNSVATSAMFASFVLDLKTGYKLQLGQPTAYCFAFSPDGSALVAAQKDGGVEYSLPDANAAAHYPGPIEAIAFTSDGRHVLTRANGQILRWPDRTPQAVISRARAVVFRQLTGEERARFELFPKP